MEPTKSTSAHASVISAKKKHIKRRMKNKSRKKPGVGLNNKYSKKNKKKGKEREILVEHERDFSSAGQLVTLRPGGRGKDQKQLALLVYHLKGQTVLGEPAQGKGERERSQRKCSRQTTKMLKKERIRPLLH